MHRESGAGLPRWAMPEKTLIRLTASRSGEHWIYQFPPEEWAAAVRRIMADTRQGKITDTAASGLLALIAEGVDES